MSEPGKSAFTTIPEFKPGRTRPSPWSASDMNRIVRVLNAILRMRIIREGRRDLVRWEPGGLVLQLAEEVRARETTGEAARNRVRVRVCDPETGQVEIWELEGRRVG